MSTNDFSKYKVVSFDTETSGVDENIAKIWQIGAASNTGKQFEHNINPFKTENLTPIEVIDRLRKSNGFFSENAYQKGDFNNLFEQLKSNKTNSIEESFSVLSNMVSSSDIALVQNINFENKFIKHEADTVLSTEVNNLLNSVEFSNLSVANTSMNNLLVRPPEVVATTRKAEEMFYTKLLGSNNEELFQEYLSLRNNSIDAYKSAIDNPNRKKAVAVELMDFSKALFANAADKGLIDKSTIMLGTNMEFLTKNLFGEIEEHTALADSKHQIRVFDKVSEMLQEFKQNKVSQNTLNIFERIRKSQPLEINSKFLSSIRSVLQDFYDRGYSKISAGKSWYAPKEIISDSSGKVSYLPKVKHGIGGLKTYSVSEAIDSVVDRYSHFNENLNGFSRESLAKDVVEMVSKGEKIPDIIDSLHVMSSDLSKKSSSFDAEQTLNKASSISNKHNFNLSKKHVLGVAAIAGLGSMFFSNSPEKELKNNQPVYENFYDEQYLGTAFVDFENRNKRYVY